MGVRFESESWPVVEAFVEGVVDNAEISELLEQIELWLEQGEHVAIIDLSSTQKVRFEHLTRVGLWLREQGPKNSSQRATIFVVNSPFMRAAVNFVLDMSPRPVDFQFVADTEEAREYANGLLSSIAS